MCKTIQIIEIAACETESIPKTGATAHNADSPCGGKGTILVMDDEEMIRELTFEMLTYLGYQVTTCRDGNEAITHYRFAIQSGNPFSAVIMDLTIPGGMGGKEAAQHILAINPNAILIVSSGYSSDPVMAHYDRYGFREAVAKPYKLYDLEQALNALPS